MATARELLEQADALMRRNRSREAAAADAAGGIPVLTEAVDAGDARRPAAPGPEARRAPGGDAEASAPGFGGRRSAVEVPVLTEIVEDFDQVATVIEADDAMEPPWLDFDDGTIAVGEFRRPAGGAGAVTSLPAVRTPDADDAARGAATVHDAVPAAAAAPGSSMPVALPGERDIDAARWETLAEDVRMQVLQRLDIFTDTGMQKQLTARLQPIVDRASADLVATINQQVGQLLRAYVAEAIEREIDKWRHGGGA